MAFSFTKPKEYFMTCVVGVPGTGKTSTAQLLVLEALKRGENVWSNVPLAGAYKVDIEDIGTFDWSTLDAEGNRNDGGLLIIDEAGLVANNRDWKGFPKGFLEFLKLHRHYKVDVYFFSQGVDMDVSIRRLSTRWYKFSKCRIPLIGHNYTNIIPVVSDIVINNGKFDLVYTAKDGFIDIKRMPIYKSFGLFDSFSTPDLPIVEFKKWSEIIIRKHNGKFTIKIKLKRFLRYLSLKLYKFSNKKLWGDEDWKH